VIVGLSTPAGAAEQWGPAPSCLIYGPSSEKFCVNDDGLEIVATNHCEQKLRIEICIGRRGKKPNCGTDIAAPGHSVRFYACTPNNKVGVRAYVVASPKPKPARAKPAAPPTCAADAFYSSYTKRCEHCDGMMVEGQCIAD
jgi:hypothetical protein